MPYAFGSAGTLLHAIDPVNFDFSTGYAMPNDVHRMGVDPMLRKVYTASADANASVLEVDSGEVVNLGHLGDTSVGSPTAIVVNPNNHFVFFLTYSPALIFVFNGHNYAYIDTLALTDAKTMALDPIANLLYVAYEAGLAIINATTLQIVDTFVSPLFAGNINAIAIDPCRGRLYASNENRASLVMFDLEARSVLLEEPASSPPLKLIADQRQGMLYVLGSGGTLNRYNSCNLSFVSSSWGALQPMDIALDQMSGLLYVPSSSSANLVVIDSQSASVFRSIGNGITTTQAVVMACTPACAGQSCESSGFGLSETAAGTAAPAAQSRMVPRQLPR